jgi:hypothetical protein
MLKGAISVMVGIDAVTAVMGVMAVEPTVDQ